MSNIWPLSLTKPITSPLGFIMAFWSIAEPIKLPVVLKIEFE